MNAARTTGTAAIAVAALLAFATSSAGDTTASPRLALSLVSGTSQPRLRLEQRQIERAWGGSEDSVYREIEIPQWRSEGTASVLSAALPGAGQAYVGSQRAWVYALAEVAGWTGRLLYLRRGHDLQNDAASYVGTPADTTSRWSFSRWEQATNGDATELRALFDRDRNVFYDEIGRDPGLLEGWAGDPAATRARFSEMRKQGDDRLRYARYAGTGLWINHVVSALDALRAARLHNVSLGHDMRLGLSSGWRHGAPTVTAELKRTF
jgi:hypothetical protein